MGYDRDPWRDISCSFAPGSFQSPLGRVARHVTAGCKTFSGDIVGGGSHIAYPRGVNPFIVEIEECAYGDGIVQRLLAPARSLYLLYVLLLKPTGLPIHFLDEGKQCLFTIADRSSSIILQYSGDQRAISQQGRRDRGVRADSEPTVVPLGGKGRDQLAETCG